MGKLIFSMFMCMMLLLVSTNCWAFETITAEKRKHLRSEKFYQDSWCLEQGGITGVYLPDGTIVDCVTGSNAVEVDFASKFYEAIGQSLHYSTQTGKKAGILLIIESPRDEIYHERLKHVIEQFELPIEVYVIKP